VKDYRKRLQSADSASANGGHFEHLYKSLFFIYFLFFHFVVFVAFSPYLYVCMFSFPCYH